MTAPLTIRVDGHEVVVDDDTDTLLGVLRDQLGLRDVKDGCAPQGQCGCCTVLVDGQPRVACVLPVRRVRGRDITTPSHVAGAEAWAEALCATGGSQCGFCTPGIVARLAALHERQPDAGADAVDQALLAHLCRCTGWQTIREAWAVVGAEHPERDLVAAGARASLEGGARQRVDPDVALGRAPFADDTAAEGSLVAVLDPAGTWTLGTSVAEARRLAGAIQGRRTTAPAEPPIPVPDGAWDLVLATSWVEPGYLELDASWCEPGGDPASPLANGGAFGAKADSPLPAAARALADEQGGPVRARWMREDAVQLGPKRPPLAAGLRRDGTGVMRVARTAGIAEAIRAALPAVEVEEIDVVGPPTSTAIRVAGWAEAATLAAVLTGPDADGWLGPVTGPGGGTARARVHDGTIQVHVDAGDPLDVVALRSYCIGAAHQAASWVTSEAIAVDAEGIVHDRTIRSFGILRAVDTPPIEVEIADAPGPAVAVSDAVLAAVAAAVWAHQGTPPTWPTRVPLRSAGATVAP